MSEQPQSSSVALNPFEKQVKLALKLYSKPERLGAESPLASAYFLGRALADAPRPVTPQARGMALQAQLRAAAAQLWGAELPGDRDGMQAAISGVRQQPDSPRYAYVVLELRCFQQHMQPRRTSDIWEQPHLLPGSKSQHYREFDLAVRYLAGMLLERLRPTMRLERPAPPPELIGYEPELHQATAALEDGGAVAVLGPGGVGKTSLGATLLTRFDAARTFWYTLRPGVNDNPHSLLFALGYFLHSNDAPNLWHYLVAAGGSAGDLNVALGLLRQDLATLAAPPLLCFDDLEYLHAPKPDELPAERAVLRELLESLHGAAPLLLLGQRALFAAQHLIELDGLGPQHIQQLWHASDRALSSDEAQQLHIFTGGNPRLLVLCRALHASGETVRQILSMGAADAGLAPIFDRLWRRLSADERRLMQRLAVFRRAAPDGAWDAATLGALAALRLVAHDAAGGVAVLPALRAIIYHSMPIELRRTLHGAAATTRLDLAEYSAAAYHLWQSGNPREAVQVWFPQRAGEIARGNARAALAVFESIARNDVGKAERQALDIIRAELRQLSGQLRQGLSGLEAADWPAASELSTRAAMLRGEFEAALGYPERAISSYAEGAQTVARLLGQLARFQHRRGMLHLHQRDMADSWQAARHVAFDLHMLHGHLEEEEGRYEDAQRSFAQAQALAEQLQDDASLAEVARNQAALAGRQQQLDAAVAHANRALTIYERIGDRVNLEKMRSNLAFIYVQTRQFRAAIEAGADAYAFFRLVRDPYFAAVTAANLAEAYYELGEHARAQQYAYAVLELEEPHAHPYAHFTLGQVARAQRGEAEAHFGEAARAAQQNGDVYMVAYATRSLGVVAAEAGRAADAHAQLSAALALFQQLAISGEVAETEQLLRDLAQGELPSSQQRRTG